MPPALQKQVASASVLLAALTAACGDDPPQPAVVGEILPCLPIEAPDDGQERVVLGRVAPGGTFEALEDGAKLMVERGPQGGTHISVRVLLYATRGPMWNHRFLLYSAADGVEVGARLERTRVCTPGWTESDARVLVFSPMTEDCVIRLESMLVDANDVAIGSLHMERSVRIIAPPE